MKGSVLSFEWFRVGKSGNVIAGENGLAVHKGCV